MPLFGGKKKEKTPKRKLEAGVTGALAATDQTPEDGGQIKMTLGGNQLVFEDGVWSTDTNSGMKDGGENIKLKKHNQQLIEENNLLQFKVELLLDMLAASNADLNALEKEVQAFKSQKVRSS